MREVAEGLALQLLKFAVDAGFDGVAMMGAGEPRVQSLDERNTS